MKALKGTLIALMLLLAMALGGMLWGYHWFRENHIKAGGRLYDIHTQVVDLRGTETSFQEYEQLCQKLPNAMIHWDVPFQGNRYPDDSRSITITSLSEEDIVGLSYLPHLTYIDATQCRDYENLLTLEKQRPNCTVDFRIHLGNMALERNTASLVLESDDATAEEFRAAVMYLPGLTSVTLNNPTVPAADIYAMQEQYPNITFTWNKEFMGKLYGEDLEELDLSRSKPGELPTLAELEDNLAYYPNLKSVNLEHCGFDNEELAAYRDRVRDHYKVIWGVNIGKAYLRTDATGFIPSNQNARVFNEDTYDLRYCEDLIAVDFGHINVGNLEWVVGTPHLKYLIVGDGNVFNEDIANLRILKELEFLEIFHCPVTDISPLVECTALRDLLLSNCYIDIEPLTQMPWLENIWLLGSGVSLAEKEYLQSKIPGAHIESAGTKHSHSHGWRDLPRYFEMRDALGMGYMRG